MMYLEWTHVLLSCYLFLHLIILAPFLVTSWKQQRIIIQQNINNVNLYVFRNENVPTNEWDDYKHFKKHASSQMWIASPHEQHMTITQRPLCKIEKTQFYFPNRGRPPSQIDLPTFTPPTPRPTIWAPVWARVIISTNKNSLKKWTCRLPPLTVATRYILFWNVLPQVLCF